jgi:hypothetical protein
MNPRPFIAIAGAVFFVVALLHLARLVRQVPVQFGSTQVPMAVSYLGFPVALGLALWSWRLLRRR